MLDVAWQNMSGAQQLRRGASLSLTELPLRAGLSSRRSLMRLIYKAWWRLVAQSRCCASASRLNRNITSIVSSFHHDFSPHHLHKFLLICTQQDATQIQNEHNQERGRRLERALQASLCPAHYCALRSFITPTRISNDSTKYELHILFYALLNCHPDRLA
jgi:hypothetical protein